MSRTFGRRPAPGAWPAAPGPCAPGGGAAPHAARSAAATRVARTAATRRGSGTRRGGGPRRLADGPRLVPGAAVALLEEPSPPGPREAGDLGPPHGRVPEEVMVDVRGGRRPDHERRVQGDFLEEA